MLRQTRLRRRMNHSHPFIIHALTHRTGTRRQKEPPTHAVQRRLHALGSRRFHPDAAEHGSPERPDTAALSYRTLSWAHPTGPCSPSPSRTPLSCRCTLRSCTRTSGVPHIWWLRQKKQTNRKQSGFQDGGNLIYDLKKEFEQTY